MTEGYRIERVRLYPTVAQRRQLENYAGAHRWTWNWALAAREAHFAAHQTSLSYSEQGRALTVLQQQPDTVWLTGIPRRVKVGALRDLDKAYRAASSAASGRDSLASRHGNGAPHRSRSPTKRASTDAA